MALRSGRTTFRGIAVFAWRMFNRPKLKGLAEGSINGSIHGWVFDPASPLSRLSVQITAAGRNLTVMADRYRADLQAAGFGDGYHGFSVNTSRFANCDHVTCRVSSHNFDLPRARSMARPGNPGGGTLGHYRYSIDPHHFPGSRLNGWVVNTADPWERCHVALVVADEMCCETTACRRDIDVPAPFDKFHGFVINRPLNTKRGFSVAVLQADGSLSVLTTLS